MEQTLKEILWLHLGASLDMLENAIIVCPDELWERPSTQMGFWYMAYHALWFLHHDLTLADQRFAELVPHGGRAGIVQVSSTRVSRRRRCSDYPTGSREGNTRVVTARLE
jgi:hypothetical protein